MKTLLLTTNNQRSLENLSNYITYLNERHKDKQVDYLVTIKQNRAVRSHSQNGMYWAILTAIAAETGDTKERLHQYYALEFNWEEFRGKRIPKSTTDLDVTEFKVYVEKVKQHAREFGIYIPEPEDRAYSMWEQLTREKYDAMFSSL